MRLVLFFLVAVLAIDTLLKWWQRRHRLLRPSTNTPIPSGAAGLLAMGRFTRMLAIMRILIESAFWILVVGYVVLLIWSFAIGPIKPIHEWFTR